MWAAVLPSLSVHEEKILNSAGRPSISGMVTTRPLPTLVTLFVGFTILLTLAFAGWQEWRAREEQVRAIQTSLVNLASSLTQHAEDTVEVANTDLASLVERLEVDGTAPSALGRLDRMLEARVASEPRFRDINVLGKDGHWLASSRPGKGRNNADREYFRHFLDNSDGQVFVGPLIQSRSTGGWIITVSRRFQAADGSFGGVVVAIIEASYFVKHYAGYDLGPNSSISLLTTAGTLLARSPWNDMAVGRSFSGRVFNELRERPAGGYETTSVIDGIRRFSGYRRSEQYPLVVVASMSKDYALSAWRSSARIHIIIAIVLAGIMGLLGLGLIRQVWRGHTAEEQVRESEARYRKMAKSLQEANERVTRATDSGAIGLWEWDVTHDLMIWDAWMYRLLGLQRPDNEMPTYALWRRQLHPDDYVPAEQAVRDTLEGGKPYNTEFRVVWDDGSTHHLRASGRSICDSASGVVRIVGANWDVTEARQLTADLAHQTERLTESEAKYRLLAENMSDIVTWTGPDGAKRYVSPAALRVFGTSPQELLEHSILDFVHPDDLAAVVAFRTQFLAGTTTEGKLTFRLLHSDGGEVWVEASTRALFDAKTHAPDGFVSSIRDVTERAHLAAERDQREQDLLAANTKLESLAIHLVQARDVAERSNRAKSRFLAGMSHELRTPLNGILGYAHLLHMERDLNPVQSVRVDAMLGAGKHLLEMITCVLDLSEIEAGHVELQIAKIDVQAVAAACLDLVRPTADAKQLALSIVVAPDLPRELITDPMRLRQMLLNMLGNAVKFTARGSVELHLRSFADGSMLRIGVVDTGPGISVNQRHRLFQDFERLETEATSKVEGAGLGLALSARLAALMGGRIGCDANPIGGSVFWLDLPLHAAASSPIITAAAPPKVPDAKLVRVLDVLVVDDVLMNRDIASSFLRAAGHQVVCVGSGAEAIAAVATTDFDVVLMDVRMPEMDGLEATRQIRALEGGRGQVPIVALTAQAFADQIAECRKAGMNSHLAKPFNPETLISAVLHATVAGAAPNEAPGLTLTLPSMNVVDVAPALPVIGRELAVLDAAAFARTAAFLDPEAVTAYLQTIVKHGEGLLRRMSEPGALARSGNELARAAHTLAGSAGMFGFERLAGVGRRFERAIQSGGPEAPALANGLCDALKVTLQEISDRSAVTVTANA